MPIWLLTLVVGLGGNATHIGWAQNISFVGITDRICCSLKYHEFLKPVHADYITFIEARTDAKVFFHTDGDVFPLLDDFIEIGVDILNPIQPVGEMADFKRLNENYGDELVFCGGVDTVHVLRSASPEDVRAETRRVVDTLGKSSGFLLSSECTITHNVPPGNILAMVAEAIK